MTGTEVTAFRAEALDFLAHRVSVEADLTLSWSVQIPFRPGCTRLLAVGTQLVLFQADLGVYEVDGGPIDNGLSSWCYHALRVVEAAPSYRSEAVLVDMDGLLYRWGPGQSPRPVGRMSGPAVDTAVLGLPDDEILLQRGPHDHRELALLDCRRGELRWSLDRGSALVLPHGKSLYLEPSDQLGTVSRVDSRTGGVRWRSKSVVGGLGTFLGVVDGALWVGTRSGTVVALDVASGEPVAEVRLRTRYPDGVLDESGRLHACDGFGYDIVDLHDGGRVVAAQTFTRTAESPSLAMGRLAIIAADDRLVFADERGAVFVVHPAEPTRPERLFAGGQHFAGMGSSQGRVWVLDQSGVLRAFGKLIERSDRGMRTFFKNL